MRMQEPCQPSWLRSEARGQPRQQARNSRDQPPDPECDLVTGERPSPGIRAQTTVAERDAGTGINPSFFKSVEYRAAFTRTQRRATLLASVNISGVTGA